MSRNADPDPAQVDPLEEGAAMYKKVLRKPLTLPLRGLRVFTVNHLFAKIWSRSESLAKRPNPLGLKERRLITIALLAAQGRPEQLKEHVHGAVHDGVSEDELMEVMIHVAHYAGWPAGTAGQDVVHQVFASGDVPACAANTGSSSSSGRLEDGSTRKPSRRRGTRSRLSVRNQRMGAGSK